MPKGVSATGRISANRKTTGRKTTGRKTTGRKTTGCGGVTLVQSHMCCTAAGAALRLALH